MLDVFLGQAEPLVDQADQLEDVVGDQARVLFPRSRSSVQKTERPRTKGREVRWCI